MISNITRPFISSITDKKALLRPVLNKWFSDLLQLAPCHLEAIDAIFAQYSPILIN
jgi:hypothetical protein